MAKIEGIMMMRTEYRIVFFPFAERVQVGDRVLVKVFGITVYKRVGTIKGLFGYTWGSNAA